MIVDVVMTSMSKTPEHIALTRQAIKTLHASSSEHSFNVIVMESIALQDYAGAKSYMDPLPFNIGKVNNAALAHCHNEYIVFASNDMIFHPGWFEAILKELQAGADTACPVSPTWPHHEGMAGKVKYGYEVCHEMAGWCVVMPRRVVDAIGGFDEAFPFYYSDNDLAAKLMDKGFRHALVGDAKVTHLLSKSHDPAAAWCSEMTRVGREAFNAKWGTKYPHLRRIGR